MTNQLKLFKEQTLTSFEDVLLKCETKRLDIYFEKIDFDFQRILRFASPENIVDEDEITNQKKEIISIMKKQSCEILLSQTDYIQNLKDNVSDILELMIHMLDNKQKFWIAREAIHINEQTLSLTGLYKNHLGFGGQLPIVIFSHRIVEDIHKSSRQKFAYKEIVRETDITEKDLSLITNNIFYEHLGYSTIEEISNPLFREYFKSQLKLSDTDFNLLLEPTLVANMSLYNKYSNKYKINWDNLTCLLNAYKNIKRQSEKTKCAYPNVMWNQKISNLEKKIHWISDFDSEEGFEIQCYKKSQAFSKIVENHKLNNNLATIFSDRDSYIELTNANEDIYQTDFTKLSYWEKKYYTSRLDLIIHALKDKDIVLEKKLNMIKDGLFSFLFKNYTNRECDDLRLKEKEFKLVVGEFLVDENITKDNQQDLEDLVYDATTNLQIVKQLTGLKIKEGARRKGEDNLSFYVDERIKEISKLFCEYELLITIFDMGSFLDNKKLQEFMEIISILFEEEGREVGSLFLKQGLKIEHNINDVDEDKMYIRITNSQNMNLDEFKIRAKEVINFFANIQDFLEEKYHFYLDDNNYIASKSNNERFNQIFTGLRGHYLKKEMHRQKESLEIKRRKI